MEKVFNIMNQICDSWDHGNDDFHHGSKDKRTNILIEKVMLKWNIFDE